MNKLYLLFSAIIVSISFTAQAEDNLNQSIVFYCGTSDGEYKKEIHISDGTRVYLNQGAYSQVQAFDNLEPDSNLVHSLFDQMGIDRNCSELLMSRSTAKMVDEGNVLARVYFDFAKSNLTDRSKYVLQQLFKKMQEHPQVLDVVGHADSVGSEEFNYQLGLKRSYAVAKYLIDKGMSPKHFHMTSEGETQPIASNNTSEGREKNRRVDIQ
ncbi:OmpA family protein [Vibrio marisflavi]|uniref:Peptidoglycan-associated lipoprotein n=1 Tax=Vibrio marisflavi CECT 7928 TaxID=634439 RepID=A0ABM9A6T9_9VIBR|nr:OmpA family protein [Vibrio marisflavi]CAH0540326.1 Peptidoglycan-associated lipoprotein [Vibrio marisflavi CECT 7928]